MEHQSLYRKYRSQVFEEVVGQQHVTRTLQNALSTNRVAHAYLFTGPRGTGKTSTARLLAKSLNCEHGPTPTPCNNCDLCQAITAGRALDVVEVDAASETGIDNVREVIINNSRYAPAQGRYKVYIIDEVHDLSRAAFDGLLKTLEEPPAHVVFVLATTEVHKVPATIISRCQRFEFRRGSLEEVRSRVEEVAREEGVTVEPAAATLIARAAQGGWRDALSLLEQVVSFSDRTITAKDVGLVLGAIEDESLAELAGCILDRDAVGAIRVLDRLLSEGKDLRQLLHNFADYLRDCLLRALDPSQDGSRPLVALSAPVGMALLEQTARAEREMRWNTQHRLVLELMLFRMTALEDHAAGAAEHPGISPAAARQFPANGPGPLSDRAGAANGEVHAAPPAAVTEESRTQEPAATRSKGSALLPPPRLRPGSRSGAPATVGAGAARSEETTGAAETAGGVDPVSAENPFDAAADAALINLGLGQVQAQWKALLSRAGSKSKKLQALLRDAAPAGCEKGVLTLEFKQQYHCQAVEEPTTRRELEAIASQLFGARLRVICRLADQATAPNPAPTARRTLDTVTDSDITELFPGWDIEEV